MHHWHSHCSYFSYKCTVTQSKCIDHTEKPSNHQDINIAEIITKETPPAHFASGVDPQVLFALTANNGNKTSDFNSIDSKFNQESIRISSKKINLPTKVQPRR